MITATRKASDYAYHENALRQAVEAMGCDVISNTTSLIVLNLPGKLAGKEKDLVAGCRAHGFGIWPTGRYHRNHEPLR
jgi:alanine-glyoxylate transaminase/serine-glyoxylate transaminase/serine-pyruvate transaminase